MPAAEQSVNHETDERRKLDNYLRLSSQNDAINNIELNIPDNCEKNGFIEGRYNLGILLHFLADMIEE